MAHFEKPVSLAAFPDYAQHVQFPMDLQTVERKTKSASYGTPEDFEFDCLLQAGRGESGNRCKHCTHASGIKMLA